MHIQTSGQDRVNLGFDEDQCHWGLHMAGEYETEVEREEIIFDAYVKSLGIVF